MEIKLSKEQTQAWDYLGEVNKITSRVIYGGQAGGGKSFLICLWQIQRRLTYPGTRGYIAREVLRDLKDSVLITFFDVARLMSLKYKYNDQKSFIDFENGSRIQLLEVKYRPSDPDFNDLGSTEYTDGAIEEGVSVHKRAAEFLLSRTRYKHAEFGLTRKQLITCNPGAGWIKDEIVLPHNEGKKQKKNKFVRAILESNPNQAFVTLYKETLEGLDDPYDKARLLHGDWYAMPQTGGEFYKEFDQVKHISEVDDSRYDYDKAIHISFDENVNPYITLTVWQVEITTADEDKGVAGKKEVTQIDEFCLKHPNNTLKKLCSSFEARYNSHEAGLFIYGDATSKKQDVKLEKGYDFFSLARQYLTKFRPSLRVPLKNPSVVMRGNFINQIFRDNFDDIVINISEVCSHSIEDYNQVKEDADGTKKKDKFKDPKTQVTYERYGHCSDANDYFLCKVFENSFNLYLKGPNKPERIIRKRPQTSAY